MSTIELTRELSRGIRIVSRVCGRDIRGGFLRQGTSVRVRFPDNLDADRNRNGDQFETFLDRDLVSNGGGLACTGTVIYFTLVDVNAGAASAGTDLGCHSR